MAILNEPEQSISFTVPYLVPVSVNHYKVPTVYRLRDGTTRKGMKLTAEAKAFKAAVAIFARGRTVAPILNSERRKVQYGVTVDIYLGPNQRLDADNGGKLVLDGLEEAGVIHSDAFVSQFTVNPHKDDRLHPRTEFFVTRLESK
jgi:Holliday junction resolvase RusA-like endonuclease